MSSSGFPQEQYTIAMEFDGSDNPIYIGKAIADSLKSDPVWQIQRITYDGNGNPTDFKWANGVSSFENIWNNRAALSYS